MGYDSEAFATLLAASVGIIIVAAIIVIAWLIFYVIGLWKLFQKAGKNGWEAIIPYYNNWVLVEIAGLQWWWFLIAIASSIISIMKLDSLSFLGTIASVLANINIAYNLSKKFGKSTGWIVLTVFFGFITIPLLGYSKNDVWNNDVKVTPNGLFDAKSSASTTNDSVATESSEKTDSETSEK